MPTAKKRFASTVYTCASILLGNALLAFAIAAFAVPNSIIMGGATGLSILLSRFIPLDVAVIVLVLNLLALLLGGVVLGKKFVLTTVASSLLYPLLLGTIQRVPGISSVTGDPLLASLFAGGLIGISVGMVMRVGSSTGGMDAVSLVLHKWLHLPVSVFVYLIDFLIIGGQAVASRPESILYGIVLLVVETLTLNQVMLLGQSQIQLFIISSRFEEIRIKILTELRAGATMVLVENGCAGTPQKGVLCVIPPRKLYAAKELIQSVDPAAFITVTQIKEVRGQGFTLERREYPLER